MSTPLSVLVVDDSAVVRQVVVSILSAHPDIMVTVASDPYFAIEKMGKARPDVILLDLQMPRMDGLTFLKRIMATDPIPVVVCSGSVGRGTDTAIKALEAGAVDLVEKPALGLQEFLLDQGTTLVEVLRAAAAAKVSKQGRAPAIAPAESLLPTLPPLARPGPAVAQAAVIGLGASTGGTEALRRVLEAFPTDAPPTVVVQHMPANFTAAFAKRLDSLCQVTVKEAVPGERLVAGTVLIAPGDRHVMVRRVPDGFVADLHGGPRVSGHCPSVDVLFRSLAETSGSRTAAALLTGMGADGAEGLLRLRDAGAATFAQDEATSVVWGMPREAVVRGAAQVVLPIGQIAGALLGGSGARARGRTIAG